MRDLYLARMGITCWRLRDATPVHLWFPDVQIGLIASIGSEAEKALLDKIAEAISKTYECVDHFNHVNVNHLFLLGNFKNSQVENVIQADSLSAMLSDANLKKILWNKIKHAISNAQ